MKECLGETGKCEMCGEEGTYCYDPYNEDVNNEKILACLCEDCYQESCNDI